MGLFNDDMTGLAAAYASMNDGKYLLTNADKVGNTPAWQNRYKINETTGKMLYEMADHLKESYEEESAATSTSGATSNHDYVISGLSSCHKLYAEISESL